MSNMEARLFWIVFLALLVKLLSLNTTASARLGATHRAFSIVSSLKRHYSLDLFGVTLQPAQLAGAREQRSPQ